jgi:conjugal transfer mating pair stabilization protein TraN
MSKKIFVYLTAIFILLSSVKANAQYLCGNTGYIYRNESFCNANCGSSCEALSPTTTTAPACPSGYKGFVFDPTTNQTYAVSTNTQFWSYFDSSANSFSLAVVSDITVNSLLQSIISYNGISSAWIGLYNPQMSTDYNTVNPNRPYSWVNSSTLSYTNWASGEPNNALSSQSMGVVPQDDYGQHWIEMENSGQWNDIGYSASNPSSQDYAPYIPALVQFNNQLSCVSGTIPPTTLTTPQENNLASQYCSGNTSNCYLCTNGTSLTQCVSGNNYPSGSSELCPYGQTQCNENTSSPICPSGYTLSDSICTGTTTETGMSNPQFNGGSTGDGNGIYGITIGGNTVYAYDGQYDGCGGAQWTNPFASFSGFSMSGSIGWFCTYPILVGEGNIIQGFQVNSSYNGSYSESSVGSISVNGANVTGTTGPGSGIYTGGNQMWMNGSYQYPAPAPVCPSGYIFNSSNGECETQTCHTYCFYTRQNGRTCKTYCSWTGNTVSATYPPCMTGFYRSGSECYENGGGRLTFNSTSTTITVATNTTPTCPSGDTLSGSQCISYSCPLGGSDQCVSSTGSTPYYCSAYSCTNYNNSPAYTLNNPPINSNNPTNNGQTNSAGECTGQVYIFSGQALQCRDPGIQTGYGGGCCTANKTWFGLSNCSSEEKQLAAQRSENECTMAGTYCAQSFLGFCLQTDQTWCCFGSLLANIIQQQTRANQGLPISGWGSATSPDCIGFTPQQFQSINFSQVNLSAFYNSIEIPAANGVQNEASNAVNKFQQSLSGN